MDELQKNLQRVLSIYAFDQTGGYLLDDKGHKVRWKREHAPETSDVEKSLQTIGMRIVAVEIVGESAVGNWPDEDPALSMDTIPNQFSCAICKLLIYDPVTTNCGHNFCKGCLTKWMAKKKHSCPVCRNNIAKKWRMPINKSIHNALKTLYPEQYEARHVELVEETNQENAKAAAKQKRRRKATTDANGKTVCQRCGQSVTKITLHQQYCQAPVLKRMRTGVAGDDDDEVILSSTSSSSSSSSSSSNNTGHNFEILKDSAHIVGVCDDTAILHLPRGITHLANMELKRLSKKGYPLKQFHARILDRLMQLNEQENAAENNNKTSFDELWLEILETDGSSWRCVLM